MSEPAPKPRTVLTRATTLMMPIDVNSPLRHPLTILVCLVPTAIVAELYRWLADTRQLLLADEALAQLGTTIGTGRPVLTLLVLIVGCLSVQIAKRQPWHWPTMGTIGQVVGWALVWALVRAVIGFTGEAVLLDSTEIIPVDPIVERPGHELSLLGHIGLAMTGAIQEELIFRAGLIGLLGLALRGLGLRMLTAQLWLLIPAAVCFSLAHTDIINHYASAQPFSWPLFIQHGLGGLLYGVVFIRQGLAVATLTHGLYNGAVSFGAFDF